MLKHDRHRRILERLRAEGRVLARELPGQLGVSDDTIRRDLADLAAAGVLQRVHGGAVPSSPGLGPYPAREQRSPRSKRNIAALAAAMARDGQIIVLDGGTTTRLVARALPRGLRATVFTGSPSVAEALVDHAAIEVFLLGGRFDRSARVVVGSAAIATLGKVRADLCYVGIAGLHPEIGLTTDTLEEADVKRAMIACAAEVVGLATAEKLDTATRYVFGGLADLTQLVTDAGADPAQVARYEALGLSTRLA